MEQSTTTKMHLLHNQSYKASLKLGIVQQYVGNATVAKKLTGVGFVNVMVNGTGKERTATGTWNGQTQLVDIPEEVVKIEKL